ncbi:phosphoribosyltransferase [Rhodobacteraceae bacterium CCMM004]|nr:phosphoribosyltransferase [Rhodobacteraceae bacterium CCMM004]
MSRPVPAFWQDLLPPGTLPGGAADGYADAYPAGLPDGREIALPIRPLPEGGGAAVASLILNQASFAVEDALADRVAALLAGAAVEVVVAVPTLGLTLANAVARRLGHRRLVPLGTSRKFWYDDALSVPVTSITSPGAGKRLYLDPRTVAVLAGRRVAVVDDVLSTGATLLSVLDLLAQADVAPAAAAFAMVQGDRWRPRLAASPHAGLAIHGAVATPRLRAGPDGRYRPAP